jgi:hypothetical protein
MYDNVILGLDPRIQTDSPSLRFFAALRMTEWGYWIPASAGMTIVGRLE